MVKQSHFMQSNYTTFLQPMPRFWLLLLYEIYFFYIARGAFHNKRTPVIPKDEAFNILAHVLQHTMNGQDWPDGDELSQMAYLPYFAYLRL